MDNRLPRVLSIAMAASRQMSESDPPKNLFLSGTGSVGQTVLQLLPRREVCQRKVISEAAVEKGTHTKTERQTDLTMEMNDFKRETLNAHNNFRTLHGCPPLSMSEELASTAQAWAEKIADRGILQYSENPNVGENICIVDLNLPSSRKGEHIVKEWYKEIDNYNYNDPGWKKGSYRVSQLLWKSTSEIGIGIAKLPGQNKAYVVVNYRPAGNNNMPGEFERNVLPPQKRKEDNVPPWKRRV